MGRVGVLILNDNLLCNTMDAAYDVKFSSFFNMSYTKYFHCNTHRSKLSRVFVGLHCFNVVLYIEKGNSLSVRTGFLVELVSS